MQLNNLQNKLKQKRITRKKKKNKHAQSNHTFLPLSLSFITLIIYFWRLTFGLGAMLFRREGKTKKFHSAQY